MIYKNYIKSSTVKTENPSVIRTQKAAGIVALEKKISNLLSLNIIANTHYLFDAGSTFGENDFEYPIFARPCPLVPRHGFVDSRVCKTSEELNHVSTITKEVDEQAEILVTHPINANYNLIVAGNTITVGKGNDGATGGKNCRFLYLNEDVISKKLNINDKIIANGEIPFYELVLDKEKTYLVQARSAPGVKCIKDSIPHNMKVEQIIVAEGDHLDWEALLKTVDKNKVIINHVGGSLSSHYAIHAILNGIACFTTYIPNIGDNITANTENSNEIEDNDKQSFLNEFSNGFSKFNELVALIQKSNGDTNIYTTYKEVLQFCLCILHNYSAVHQHKDYALLGYTLGIFLRTAMIISMGECRHYSGEGKFSFSSRDKLYTHFGESVDTANFLEKTKNAYIIFNYGSWSSSYGGPKWAECTRFVINMFNNCIDLKIKEVVEDFNKVVHLSHNGGFYLNKVISVEEFTEANLHPSEFLLSRILKIVPVLYSRDILNIQINMSPLTKFDIQNWDKSMLSSISPKLNTITAPKNKPVPAPSISNSTSTTKSKFKSLTSENFNKVMNEKAFVNKIHLPYLEALIDSGKESFDTLETKFSAFKKCDPELTESIINNFKSKFSSKSSDSSLISSSKNYPISTVIDTYLQGEECTILYKDLLKKVKNVKSYYIINYGNYYYILIDNIIYKSVELENITSKTPLSLYILVNSITKISNTAAYWCNIDSYNLLTGMLTCKSISKKNINNFFASTFTYNIPYYNATNLSKLLVMYLHQNPEMLEYIYWKTVSNYKVISPITEGIKEETLTNNTLQSDLNINSLLDFYKNILLYKSTLTDISNSVDLKPAEFIPSDIIEEF